MANFSKAEVDALSKTLAALSSRKMEAQYLLKIAHRSEDTLCSRCLQLHHEKSLAEANFNAVVSVIELLGWKAQTDKQGRFVSLLSAHADQPLEVFEVYDRWNSAKREPEGLLRRFPNADKCREWLMSGIRSCEGAERDHYVKMLQEMESGDHRLYYY